MTELTCILCPMGCALVVQESEAGFDVTGYSCLRGRQYALDEVIAPKRVVTAVVKVKGYSKMLSVKSAEPIPKIALQAAMEQIKQIVIETPIKIGEVVKPNLAGTGISLIATKNWV